MVFKQPCQTEKIFPFGNCYAVVCKAAQIVLALLWCKNKGFDKFQEIFVFSGIGWILLAACAVITGILYLIDYKKPNITISKAVPIALAVVFGLCAVAIIGIMVYFSCIDTKTASAALKDYPL